MSELQFPYERVAGDLARRIRSGELTGQLPGRLKLAEQYEVSYMTVSRALQVLKDQGLIVARPGLGTFVA